MPSRFFPWMTHFFAIIVLSMIATPALSNSLDDFRKSGAIIERFDGLVEAAPSAPSAARTLVNSVNAKRRSLYNDRAKQQGAPVSEVAKIYAQQIFASAPKGTKFRRSDGSIVRK